MISQITQKHDGKLSTHRGWWPKTKRVIGLKKQNGWNRIEWPRRSRLSSRGWSKSKSNKKSWKPKLQLQSRPERRLSRVVHPI